MKPVTLSLSQSDLEGLYERADTKGKFIKGKVETQVMTDLLMDYSKLIAKVQELHIEVEELP